MAAVPSPSLQPRQLSSEEEQKLSSERVLVSDFKQQQLEKEARKNWDLFYKRNSTHFFKDRHWTSREFGELKACREVRRVSPVCGAAVQGEEEGDLRLWKVRSGELPQLHGVDVKWS